MVLHPLTTSGLSTPLITVETTIFPTVDHHYLRRKKPNRFDIYHLSTFSSFIVSESSIELITCRVRYKVVKFIQTQNLPGCCYILDYILVWTKSLIVTILFLGSKCKVILATLSILVECEWKSLLNVALIFKYNATLGKLSHSLLYLIPGKLSLPYLFIDLSHSHYLSWQVKV